MKILVIDIGGSNVKLYLSRTEKRKFHSGPAMTPRQFVREAKKLTADWTFEAISIGFPGPIVSGKPSVEPNNLGKGWKGFDFTAAFGKPAKVMNDAAMQALGSYDGGRMLFLGLGTGLGSALILDEVVVPLELGELPQSRTRTFEDILGKRGVKRLGVKRWEMFVHELVGKLQTAFLADYVVLGGGNAKKLSALPKNARRGDNDNAYLGGTRLWRTTGLRVKRKKHTLELKAG